MRIAVFCQPQELCFSCYETGGGEFDAPLRFHCKDEVCKFPERDCLFVKAGGKRVK